MAISPSKGSPVLQVIAIPLSHNPLKVWKQPTKEAVWGGFMHNRDVASIGYETPRFIPLIPMPKVGRSHGNEMMMIESEA